MAKLYICKDEITEPLRFAMEHLGAQGLEVEHASDLPTARELFRKGPPDILLAGLWVRHADVFLVLRTLREECPGARPACILLTAMGATGEPSTYWPERFDAYLMPPVSGWQIVLTVEQFLHRRVLPLE